ncbi:hypothetical protein C8Q75DRAFT_615742 [Abortiporus biennis]|nr:hypothetical protein C8Q75DRAFT_615742 [Abortiporus biennis]
MLLYTDSYPYYFQYVHSKAHKTTREMALTGKGHTISYPEGKYYINKLITYDLVTLQKITSDSLPKGYEPDWIPFTIKVLIASNILDEHPEEARVFIEWMDELAAFVRDLQGANIWKKFIGRYRIRSMVSQIGQRAVKLLGLRLFCHLWRLILLFEHEIPDKALEVVSLIAKKDGKAFDLIHERRELQHLHNCCPPPITNCEFPPNGLLENYLQ